MESRSWFRALTAVAVVVTLTVLALGVAAGSAPAGNRSPLSELVVLPGPAGVTNGQKVALTARLVNGEKSMYTKIFFRLPIPLGASFNSTSCASFALVANEFVCEWGDQLPAGSTATVVIVLQTPASGSAMTAAGTWSIKEGKPTNANEAFATNPVDVPLFATNDALKAAGFMTTACTSPASPTIATPPVGPGNPLSTSICAPNLPTIPVPGIAASILERDRTASDPGFTQVSDICLPQPTSDCGPSIVPFVFSPLATFTFTIDAAHHAPMITKVFHDGVLVPSTSTDPLIQSITFNSTANTTTVVVKSSENGQWNFG